MRVPKAPVTSTGYRLCIREHAGARGLLEEVGALPEIEAAILEHCRDAAPEPPRYAPQAIKGKLCGAGWLPEVRVPPMTKAHDARVMNDRYDAWKAFDRATGQIGVGLEIEHWEINNDLLKFLGASGADRSQSASSSTPIQARSPMRTSTACGWQNRFGKVYRSSSAHPRGRGFLPMACLRPKRRSMRRFASPRGRVG